jgi:hypothetical protein
LDDEVFCFLDEFDAGSFFDGGDTIAVGTELGWLVAGVAFLAGGVMAFVLGGVGFVAAAGGVMIVAPCRAGGMVGLCRAGVVVAIFCGCALAEVVVVVC